MNILDEDIRKGTFRRVYLLYGDEPYLMDYYEKKLVRAVLGEGDEINLNRFREKEADQNRAHRRP